ncbi:MAG TPA: Plug domain-containing protein [Gemmatimonadaceae bacterium]
MPQRDTTRRDSVRAAGDTLVVPVPPQEDAPIRDSLPAAVALDTLRDTLQAPLARAELPVALEIGDAYRWDRDALFASGALTLAELLERIPGFNSFTSGWISTPSAGAFIGDAARVRVFHDGVAIDLLDPREHGIPDLADIQIWTLEEVLVERGATELRVHLRSWSVERIVPVTRTDVGTGDQRTNVFRGFYGKRWRNGAAFQAGGQQIGSNAEYPFGADGDELSFFARAGWARGPWSADGFLLSARRSRSAQPSYTTFDALPGLDRTRALAYVRFGYGDPAAGLWAQTIASAQRVSAEYADEDDAFERSLAQYIATGGFTRWGLRLSGTARLRAGDDETSVSGAGRLAWERSFAGIAALVERDEADTVDRAEISARISPFSWLSLTGAVGRTLEDHSGIARLSGGVPDPFDPGLVVVAQDEVTYARGELGVRVRGTWIGAGVLTRTESRLAGLGIFDPAYAAVHDAEATGVFGTARGRLWRDVHVDAMVTVWDSASYYRPRWQTRTTLALVTRWLSRFPSGDFGLRFAVTHAYRSDVLFPTADGTRTAPGLYETGQVVNNSVSTHLEIRIADATLYWQLRNVTGKYTEEVPGFLRPRQTNLYGVRWEFTN